MLNFFSLPGEVRNIVYHKALVRDQEILYIYNDICHPKGPRLSSLVVLGDRNPQQSEASRDGNNNPVSAILLANKHINAEATPILYSQNIYRLESSHTDYIINKFLGSIGSHNAGHIAHLCIAFPNFTAEESTYPNNIVFGCQRVVRNIRHHCLNLDVLEILMPPGCYAGYLTNPEPNESPGLAIKTLSFVDTECKLFTGLKEVIVHVWERTHHPAVRAELRRCGWTIRLEPDVQDGDVFW
ncbi:hypothetical protein B0H66DRAFT_554869 [Apodospora peruviana]|uniref:Uncharacterized protein n=1 Tax=Apodospora peruviana TaxID=516989 RepID=A0AAE0ICI9_9PEZI|nr:hypothetical protein B0H66DRAFT_554869 [Apodospora peruviana]